MAMAGLMAFVSCVHADPTSGSGRDDDPNLQYDRDGVPLNITMQKVQRATPTEIAADRKAREEAALEKDWLLRAYEKQLQTHSVTSTAVDRDANPYQEISGNKDLAKLAGLTDYHNDAASDEPLYRTKDASANQGAVGLRTGSATSSPFLSSAPFGSSFLKPLVTPISAPDAAGIKNFYASLPDASVAPFNGSTPAPQLHARASIIPDPTDNDIETPGMIAAKNDPSVEPGLSDADLDILPGESLKHAKAHQDNSESLLQLPIVMDADQLHRAQADYLTPPAPKGGAPNPSTAAAPVKPPPTREEDPEAPVQASQMPMIMPGGAPLGNPYDILNR